MIRCGLVAGAPFERNSKPSAMTGCALSRTDNGVKHFPSNFILASVSMPVINQSMISAGAITVVAIAVSIAFATQVQNASDSHKDCFHGETVAYRLAKWREMHFKDSESATSHLNAVRRLGCEAWLENHSGHIDVVYRCPQWLRLSLKTHQLAEQQSEWLKAAGFDTHHAHTHESFVLGNETLSVRLTDWRTIHLDDIEANVAERIVSVLQDVGSDTRYEAHDDHTDVLYRCPAPTILHFAHRTQAERLQPLLEGYGFEVARLDGTR